MAQHYDRPRKEIFMTRDAYNNMRALCGEKLFRRLSVSNIQYDYKHRHVTRHGFHIMLEYYPADESAVMEIINAHRSVRMGVFRDNRGDYVMHANMQQKVR
jgi:hypothetical protein